MTSEVKDGGPAFPTSPKEIDTATTVEVGGEEITTKVHLEQDPPSGMSLLDYFAAKAMLGMFSSSTNLAAIIEACKGSGQRHTELIAFNAYNAAADMIAERNKRTPGSEAGEADADN